MHHHFIKQFERTLFAARTTPHAACVEQVLLPVQPWELPEQHRVHGPTQVSARLHFFPQHAAGTRLCAADSPLNAEEERRFCGTTHTPTEIGQNVALPPAARNLYAHGGATPHHHTEDSAVLLHRSMPHVAQTSCRSLLNTHARSYRRHTENLEGYRSDAWFKQKVLPELVIIFTHVSKPRCERMSARK